MRSDVTVNLFDMIITEDPKTFDTIYLVMNLCHSDLAKLCKSKNYLKNK